MSPSLVFGLTRSYFTRKVTGYLDYTDRPWRLEPGIREHPAATEAASSPTSTGRRSWANPATPARMPSTGVDPTRQLEARSRLEPISTGRE